MNVIFAGVWKRYGTFVAVENLELEIKAGALHFLLGPSGCGKTTTLRMLAGLESVSQGRIFMGGKDVTHATPQDRGIGMVFQNYALWPHMTVRKNIEYGLRLKKLSEAEIKSRRAEVVAITQLERFLEKLPAQLSGGQQQRVALSRALAIRPNILLLDEPLSNLDAKLRLEMRDNISRIHRETGITTLYVTHDQKEALSMGTEVSVMHGGHLLQTSTPRDLYHRPRTSFVASFIGEANLIGGKISWRNGLTARVDTPIGTLSGALGDQSLQTGDDVVVAMRPEAVRITGQRAEDDNCFPATLQNGTYLGETEQLTLGLATGEAIKATLFHGPAHNLATGMAVNCSVAARDTLILKPQDLAGQGT